MSPRSLVVPAAFGALLLVAGGALRAEPRSAASILGHYRVQGSGMVIAIADCGEGQLCGRIVGLPDPRIQKSLPPQETLCGLTVLTQLQPDETGGWQGRFHDPVLGGDYTLNILPANAFANGALRVQRYSSPPFLTRSMPRIETWTSTAPPASCNTATPTS